MDWLRRRVRADHTAGLEEAVIGCGVAVVGIAALSVALSPLRLHLGLLDVGLLYLLLVVLIAARWGLAPGLFASAVAHLALDYFFVPPLHQLFTAEPDDTLDLLVFLGVAVVTSGLLARARAGEAAARRREGETALLYDLSRLIIVEPDAVSALAAICRRVRETFSAESSAVVLRVAGDLAVVASDGPAGAGSVTVDERRAMERAMASGRLVALGGRPGGAVPRIVGVSGRQVPVVYVPLRMGGGVAGVLRVSGRLRPRVSADDEVRLLEAFADEAALAADRDRLLREAARAEALQEADRLKSALLSAVSHDLRTPLASIKASASSLLQPDIEWDAETQREFLTAIDEETDRLTHLVGNLLDLSRIEGGALRPERDWYDVRELLETVAGRIGRTVAHHRLVLDVAPDTGEALIDYVQIGQVLMNLVENAVKFAPEGSEIRIAAIRRGPELELSVADRGPGVPAAERERVFEKFYRAEHTGAGTPGTGLGLAIARGLVEAHGGRIWVEDAPGGGARFVFVLPGARVVTPAEAASDHAAALVQP
jgi:two-component system sensor histidine kinase KdpD